MTREIWGGTRNGDHHFGKDYFAAQLGAAGYVTQPKGAQPRFNGGLASPREVRLQRGDKIYRFCGSKILSLENQVNGWWWFDEDMCILLWSLSDGTDNSFRQAARTMFAVLPEWSDMNFCVSGRLKYDYWAIRGTTAQARGKQDTASNPYGQEARQLYVPGKLSRDAFGDVRSVSLTRVVY